MKLLTVGLACGFYFLITAINAQQIVVPEWSKGVLWYQIFPERFSNGDLSNDPTLADIKVHGRIMILQLGIYRPGRQTGMLFNHGKKKMGKTLVIKCNAEDMVAIFRALSINSIIYNL